MVGKTHLEKSHDVCLGYRGSQLFSKAYCPPGFSESFLPAWLKSVRRNSPGGNSLWLSWYQDQYPRFRRNGRRGLTEFSPTILKATTEADKKNDRPRRFLYIEDWLWIQQSHHRRNLRFYVDHCPLLRGYCGRSRFGLLSCDGARLLMKLRNTSSFAGEMPTKQKPTSILWSSLPSLITPLRSLSHHYSIFRGPPSILGSDPDKRTMPVRSSCRQGHRQT
jgi:hypothetical protein